MRIEVTFLNVIHWKYNPKAKEDSLKTTFEFGHQIGKHHMTMKVNAINFRLVTRWRNANEQVLSYIAEQTFKFVDNLSTLTSDDFAGVIKEVYKNYVHEFNIQDPRPKYNLKVDYPTAQVQNLMFKQLTGSDMR